MRGKPALGQRFGRLLVVEDLDGGLSRCACDCGGEVLVTRNNLRTNHTKSCGCARAERNRERLKTHGMRRSPEWSSWAAMKARCLNPKNRKFPVYGGRGISVCARWAESFEAFLADMGERPTRAHSLDRIDNDGNYEPGNVRWATKAQQSTNRRNTRFVTHNGETLCLAEWARRSGVRRLTIVKRLAAGWSFERAITEPSNYRSRRTA